MYNGCGEPLCIHVNVVIIIAMVKWQGHILGWSDMLTAVTALDRVPVGVTPLLDFMSLLAYIE